MSRAELVATFRDLEARLTGRALAWVGGIALVLGMIFFTSLAFSRGWIGPELRVVIGIIAGSVALAAGGLFMERRNRLLGHVLTPVGLAVITISLVGATRLYGFIPVEVGLVGALISAAVVAIVAVRADAPVVAGFGLIGVLVAPPLLDAPADTATLAYVAVVLLATTVVALSRSWRWLPPVAFLLAAPQIAVWINGEPATSLGLAGLGAFWALNVVAAGGETVRRGRDDLSSTSATLLLANVAFLIAAGFRVLDGDLTASRGPFLVVIALAHFIVGGSFIARHGERHLFSLLTLGTGIAALTMAAPIQLGAAVVPVAWTAQAVALVALAVWRRHPYSASVSGILYVLAGAYLMALYAGLEAASPFLPMVDSHGATLAFFLAGIGAGVLIVRDLALRSTLLAFGLLVATVCAWLGLAHPAGVVAMTMLAVVGAIGWRSLPTVADRPIDWQILGLIPEGLRRTVEWRSTLGAALPGVLIVIGLAVVAKLLAAFFGPAATFGDIPFVDPAGAALAFALLGLGAIARLSPYEPIRHPLLAIGLLMVAAVCPAELNGPALAVALAASAILGLWATVIASAQPMVYLVPSLSLAVFAVTYTIAEVAPPDLLLVSDTRVEPFQAVGRFVALASIVLYLVAFAVIQRATAWARWAWLGAGITLVYLLSIAVVDVVGTQVGGTVGFEELRTQGQVALSVLWTVLGAIAFIAGLRSRVALLRQAGLGLLALATAKVFLFDLASLDVAYRVISLIALGLLLLASAGLWQRVQVRPAPAVEPPVPTPGAGPPS